MYTAKDFSHLLGLEGMSDTLLNNHFTLYGGYVTNVNTLMKKMNEIREDRLAGNDDRKEESAELHRRFGWEYNGMKLHELYFENMVKGGSTYNGESAFGKALTARFGSFENFTHNFTKNVGMFRGIGWVALIKRDDTLGVIWIGEHDEGLLANSKILLIMDVFEHAFITDYGIKRADYIATFMKAINWSVVEARFA
jgi:Fe-Mn family superoxide dismutase